MDRWDPKFLSFNNSFRFEFKSCKLKSILREKPFYGANEPGIERISKEQARYIRITDIDEYGLLSNELGATCIISNDKYLLQNNDLLIARSGNTVGKSYIHTNSNPIDKFIFAGYLINFRINEDFAFPKFVFYYLQCSFFSDWKNATMRLAGQPNINAQEYKNMLIPLPDKNTQKLIIEIMDDAYLQKKEMEQQAESLLSNVNQYFLSRLGVKISLVDDTALKDRIFSIDSLKVIGGRFDPKKYSKKYQQLFNAIENAIFDKVRLRDMIKVSLSGNWGVDESFDDESLVKYLTIRGTEFDNRYNLLLDNNRAKYRKYSPELFDKIKLRSNDILIEKSGGSENQPVGRVAFIDSELEKEALAYSNFLQKIRIDEEIAIPEYVFEYLKLMHNIKVTEVMQTQTNGIRNLILKEYFNQTIILPDKDIQKEIVAHIRDIREQAKRLEEEAENIVKDAKKQVEEILLGDVL